jgi:hypothetical protein
MLVRSQGRTRAAVLLGRRPDAFGFASRATVRFRVEGEDIADDGLLVIELADSMLAPAYGHAPHAASGVRIDTLRIAPVDAEPADDAARTGAELVEHGLAGTGLPPRSGRAPLSDNLFTVSAGETWRLRARLMRPLPPDAARPSPGPPWPRPLTGAPQLRMREKAVLLVKHRARQARRDLARRAGHATARALRAAEKPIDALGTLAMRREIERGRLRADIIELSATATGTAVPCLIRYRGRGTVELTAPAPVTTASVVRLSTEPRRFRRNRRYAWQLLAGGGR